MIKIMTVGKSTITIKVQGNEVSIMQGAKSLTAFYNQLNCM